ncbi:LETM1-like protein-domain-containing protein [Fimicolochytrium jonesii]|uniref:LETM1-like protein-domain-containing protein n=1 Tax=Fimicolochytrium jonesii TaxID=1396493 RepID=UPI0022FF1D5A|nr:LETM1-like protein-domain-containing protein [Fimicolochytrium jonesii]KAI8819937.1 LETM1-like protein-domain-containing protein [Fimicolochytrium jonesii]
MPGIAQATRTTTLLRAASQRPSLLLGGGRMVLPATVAFYATKTKKGNAAKPAPKKPVSIPKPAIPKPAGKRVIPEMPKPSGERTATWPAEKLQPLPQTHAEQQVTEQEPIVAAKATATAERKATAASTPTPTPTAKAKPASRPEKPKVEAEAPKPTPTPTSAPEAKKTSSPTPKPTAVRPASPTPELTPRKLESDAAVTPFLRRTFIQPYITLWDGTRDIYWALVHYVPQYFDISIAQRGAKLTDRRDIRDMYRLKRDWLRAIPATLLFLPPFMAPLLPFFTKRFPRLFPTVFVHSDIQIAHTRREAESREHLKPAVIPAINAAITSSLSSSPTDAATTYDRELQMLARRWSRIASSPTTTTVTEADLLSLLPLIREHGALVTMTKEQIGPLVKFATRKGAWRRVDAQAKLYAWADWVVKDDALLRMRGGVSGLSELELVEALNERGMLSSPHPPPSTSLSLI